MEQSLQQNMGGYLFHLIRGDKMNYLDKFVEFSLKRFNAKTATTANKYFQKLKEISIEMVNCDCILELRSLFVHENIAVRCNAAFALLPFDTLEAEKVLEELSMQRGSFVYLEARMTLQEWRKGNLNFDYYKK